MNIPKNDLHMLQYRSNNIISPKFAGRLTTAILRRAHKSYPMPGIVGCYSFDGERYSNKADLKVAVAKFCAALTYDQIAAVRRNFYIT